MPKMKTHRGAKKRIKVTGTGKFVIKHSGKSHILTKKSQKRKRNFRKAAVLTSADERRIKAALGK